MNFEFKFPDVGEGIHEGKILQWKVEVGQIVKVGDIIAVVETDKVVAEIPSPKDGKIIKLNGAEGQIIHVDDVLAVIEIEGEEKEVEIVEEASTVIGQLETAKGVVLPSSGEGRIDNAQETISLKTEREPVLATPVARKMAKDLGVDITKIKGTGPGGRIMKHDVQNAAEKLVAKKEEPKAIPQQAPLASKILQPQTLDTADFKVSPLSTMRSTIAVNMEISHNIPVATVSDYIEIDELVELRKKLNTEDYHLTFTPILIKILASALKKYPLLNSHFDTTKREVKTFNSINIGFATNTEAGLVVPTLRNVEKKSINELNDEIKLLSQKAQNRTIQLEELKGGTISITNYGSFGGVYGMPKINPPQVAILGVGRIHKAPYVKNDMVIPAYILPVTLVFDHRVIDGAYAGEFLSYFLKLANSPEKLFISL
ncbi:MAG TPA: dihydrolipoamide acetyltransferase family protein [Bacteroidota bacterium]|nr:dihydrolipoamide acetyltransferase family protein [Bacteroidota bacterium]